MHLALCTERSKFWVLLPKEVQMNQFQVIKSIRAAIDLAPRNDYIAELHLQIIKYGDYLQNVTGREFCQQLGIPPSFGTEFNKMRKLHWRLRNAGMDPNRI
jgi:hypothetical protein